MLLLLLLALLYNVISKWYKIDNKQSFVRIYYIACKIELWLKIKIIRYVLAYTYPYFKYLSERVNTGKLLVHMYNVKLSTNVLKNDMTTSKEFYWTLGESCKIMNLGFVFIFLLKKKKTGINSLNRFCSLYYFGVVILTWSQFSVRYIWYNIDFFKKL